MTDTTDPEVALEAMFDTTDKLAANVVNLESVKKKREELRTAAQRINGNKRDQKLTRAELAQTLEKAGEVIDEQYALLQALTRDILLLAQTYKEAQVNMTMVSAQAFLIMEVIKEKGLCTSEELQSRWQKLLKEQLVSPEEEKLVQPQESAIIIPGPGQVDLRRR